MDIYGLIPLHVWIEWAVTHSKNFMSIGTLEIYLLETLVMCFILLLPAVNVRYEVKTNKRYQHKLTKSRAMCMFTIYAIRRGNV